MSMPAGTVLERMFVQHSDEIRVSSEVVLNTDKDKMMEVERE